MAITMWIGTLSYTEKPNNIADELRAFALELEKLAQASSVFSIVSPIIANACDHILLRARYSDLLQEEQGPDWAVNEVTYSIDVDR